MVADLKKTTENKNLGMPLEAASGYVPCQKDMENNFSCPEQKDVTLVQGSEIFIV